MLHYVLLTKGIFMIKLSFTQEQIDKLHFERFNHPSPKVRLKMEALFLKSQGLAHYQIQKICQISSVTLTTYIKQYAQGGIERLKVNLHKGKPNELQKHAQELKELFKRNPPASTKEAAKIIEEQTGIRRGLTQIRVFLKSIGLKYRKVGAIPAKVLTEDLAQKQDQFQAESIAPKLDEAKTGEREVFFWTQPTSCMGLSWGTCGVNSACLCRLPQEGIVLMSWVRSMLLPKKPLGLKQPLTSILRVFASCCLS
jgi:transposase